MACICQRMRKLSISHRAFSTSARREASLQLGVIDPELKASLVPAYPYGSKQWYKQADLGLYGGQSIRFGNNTNEEKKQRTRRPWSPNVQNKRLFSKSLDRYVELRVTTRVMRTIDKLGGLDEYLLGEKTARIKELGETGWWLRWAIMQTKQVKNRFDEQRSDNDIPVKKDFKRTARSIANAQDAAEREAAPMQRLSRQHSAARMRLRFRVGRNEVMHFTRGGWQMRRPLKANLTRQLRSREPLSSVALSEDIDFKEKHAKFWKEVRERQETRYEERADNLNRFLKDATLTLQRAEEKVQQAQEKVWQAGNEAGNKKAKKDAERERQEASTLKEEYEETVEERRAEVQAAKAQCEQFEEQRSLLPSKIEELATLYNVEWAREQYFKEQKRKAGALRGQIKQVGSVL